MRFAKYKDDNYATPKDKLPWKIKDTRPNKYEMKGVRFIIAKELKGKFEYLEHLDED